MLNLDSKITLNLATIKAKNICDKFSEEDLQRIGNYVWTGYDQDEQSRDKWLRRTEAAMDLAMQVQKPKTFPWPDCSNIAFPIITIAALQFHARAYSTLINGLDVVKCRTIGPDPTGAGKARSGRISCHMSYQVLEEDAAWEEQHDRALINLPIVGCVFFKTYYSASKKHNVSELVLAKDLVVNYYAKSLEDCPRKTHVLPFFRNDLRERGLRGVFRNVENEAWFDAAAQQPTSDPKADNRKGQTQPQPDQDTPFVCLEQHCVLDLDKDGYAEPYIITIDRDSRYVLRIVAAFDREEDIERTESGKIISITRNEYFTKVPFIPSPDGGIYDLGFGVLLGPLNESVNSLINQLVDAGTWSTTAGGFLGRGAKIRGGVYSFAPLEWKRVDSTGDDLRKNIVPLDVREPSQVLFSLLSLLINYANRIPGTTDTMVGENPGQNTPAENMREMVAQGSKIYNNLFKRVWRSMKDEFKKLYILNGKYLDTRKDFGPESYVMREDYLGDPGQVCPAADPNLVSDADRLRQAMTIKQSAQGTPGYDVGAVERNFLDALRVEGKDLLYPGPEKMPPAQNPKVQVEEMRLKGKQLQFQHEMMTTAMELMETRRLNNARIAKLEAEAAQIVNDIGLDQARVSISAFDAAIGALKHHNDVLDKHIERVMKETEDATGGNGGGLPLMAAAPGNEGFAAGGETEEEDFTGAMV